MTPEERKQAKAAERLAAITGNRAGTGASAIPKPTTPEHPKLSELDLTEIMKKPVEWFRPDPENEEFQALKDRRPQYWEDLKRDIQATGILTPLLATPDGLLLQGHSRLKIAKELGLKRVPCRIVNSTMTGEEIRNRRRLDNLLRFEIDENTRLSMLAQVWPEFYQTAGKAGKQSDHGDTITAGEIAVKTGKSVPQVKRDRALVREAAALAKKEGHPAPKPEHIAQAREKKNAERREAGTTGRKTLDQTGHGDTIAQGPNVSPEAITKEPVVLDFLTVHAVWNTLYKQIEANKKAYPGESPDTHAGRVIGYSKALAIVEKLMGELSGGKK